MDARRAELDLTWDKAAELASVSKETLFQVARGRHPRKLTRARIERAFGWRAGSIDTVLAGGEPVQIEQESPAEVDDELRDIAELREMAKTAQARAEESLAVARELFNRIERLGHSDEHRSAQ